MTSQAKILIGAAALTFGLSLWLSRPVTPEPPQKNAQSQTSIPAQESPLPGESANPTPGATGRPVPEIQGTPATPSRTVRKRRPRTSAELREEAAIRYRMQVQAEEARRRQQYESDSSPEGN